MVSGLRQGRLVLPPPPDITPRPGTRSPSFKVLAGAVIGILQRDSAIFCIAGSDYRRQSAAVLAATAAGRDFRCISLRAAHSGPRETTQGHGQNASRHGDRAVSGQIDTGCERSPSRRRAPPPPRRRRGQQLLGQAPNHRAAKFARRLNRYSRQLMDQILALGPGSAPALVAPDAAGQAGREFWRRTRGAAHRWPREATVMRPRCPPRG